MAVFIAEDLKHIFLTTLRKTIKKDVIDEENVSKLINVDLDKKENMLNVKKFDIGFASRALIEQLDEKTKGATAAVAFILLTLFSK